MRVQGGDKHYTSVKTVANDGTHSLASLVRKERNFHNFCPRSPASGGDALWNTVGFPVKPIGQTLTCSRFQHYRTVIVMRHASNQRNPSQIALWLLPACTAWCVRASRYSKVMCQLLHGTSVGALRPALQPIRDSKEPAS